MLESISLNSKERTKKRRQRRSLINNFGINADQYEAILKEQNGVCAICYQPEPCNRMLAVDHCHCSLKVRGLLCTNCNMAIGKFKENVEFIKNAVQYMERNYSVPEIPDSIKKINHNDRPNWKMLVTTPEGLFPSLQHAADHYKVHHTAIRQWCLPNSKWKKDGFSSQKMFISLNQLKDYCNVQNQSFGTVL
jgi:hypothetical protein